MRILGIWRMTAAALFMSACRSSANDTSASRAIPATPPVGRYQIVNGTPQYARDIMLLDTQTGQTWILCDAYDSTSMTASGWCAMKVYGTSGGL